MLRPPRTDGMARPGASLPEAIRRQAPSLTSFSATIGAAQPTSTWPDITCVSVAPGPPVDTSLAFTPAVSCSARATSSLDAPGRENATVRPAQSFMDRMGPSALTYQ